LINNILDAQQINLDKMNFSIKNVDVNDMMQHLHIDLKSTMEEKEIQFINSTSEKLHIKSDSEKIEQVLNNLILNAVDFVPLRDGRIEMWAQEENGYVLFNVKDNGVGISEKDQENLFTRFYQVDTSDTRKHKGAGLGLNICQGIVNGLGGKIWVESFPEKGAHFFFTIPAHKEIKVNNLKK